MLECMLLAAIHWPYTWESHGVRLTLVNPEVTPDKRYILVHLRLRGLIEQGSFDWQNQVTVLNREGQPVPQAGDCGVNDTITKGPFRVSKDKNYRVLFYYFAQASDFPCQLQVGEQLVGAPFSR
jgi:hypothetical protein